MNWIALKSLNTIYHDGKVKAKKTLEQDSQIQHLLNQTGELHKFSGFYEKGDGFDQYYEQNHLSSYSQYASFLKRTQLLKPQLRFEEEDIRILMGIEKDMENGDLHDIRQQIIENEETVRGVSRMFFKNEKYLLKSESLTNAVKQLLDIDELADDRDQQYKYVLECADPGLIVLCENLDFLKRPTIPRKHNIELWYAGGNNIAKLDYIDTRGLPIYYSCDWDHDGLKIFEAVKWKVPDIQMLYPNGEPRSIEETEHKSLWQQKNDPTQLSGLPKWLYSGKERELIRFLIENDLWIIEESNKLLEMVEMI